jgi:hypothetical protein
MPAIDLTPFGFTATEALAYGALLELGPSSGYAVAKQLSIARANAYQALDALVAKRAAVVSAANPRRYRAVQPQAVLTTIVEAQSRQIDRLEEQILAHPAAGAEPLVRVAGLRAVRETATRDIVRAEREVLCVAPPAEILALAPAFRARAAGRRPASVWCLGPVPEASVPLAGELAADVLQRHFLEPVLLLAADGALMASVGDEAQGYWSSAPLIAGVVRAAIADLVS